MRIFNFITNRINELPVLVMMPHSSCNCRCVMCDIWKANNNKKELTTEEISRHLPAFKKLKVREVVLSGGEALMHNNLWKLCEILRRDGIRITLLSTGLLLRNFAKEVAENIDEVIVSLDGSREVHDKIRNVPQAFDKLTAGVLAIRLARPTFRVTGRCVLQRANFRDFENIIRRAKEMPLDQISFLAADVSTTAFNHITEKEKDRVNEIALTLQEAKELQQIIEESITNLEGEYLSSFIAESPDKMRRVAKYYLAIAGEGTFQAPACNAPWVSAVLESDGRLMPCFFHKEYGNIYENDFEGLLNSPGAIEFRKNLSVRKNEICKKCVCSLKLRMI